MFLQWLIFTAFLSGGIAAGRAEPALESVLRIDHPLEVPVLGPGSYVLRLKDEQLAPRIASVLRTVEILDGTGTRGLATVYAFRDYRPVPEGSR